MFALNVAWIKDFFSMPVNHLYQQCTYTAININIDTIIDY